jgi:thiamine pyrophosphokinase
MAYATAHYPLSTTHYTILGATGRREDHTLGNISYLVTFAEEHPGAEITMLTNHGCFCAMTGSRTFSTFPRQQVSIFTMTPNKPIYGDGLRWPLDGFHAYRWWQATLNEALGDNVTLRTEGWLVVFLTYEPKE